MDLGGGLQELPQEAFGFPNSSVQGKNQILDINIKYIDQENCLHTLYHNAIQSLKDVIKHFYQKPN